MGVLTAYILVIGIPRKTAMKTPTAKEKGNEASGENTI